MRDETKIVLNQRTVEEAIQAYLDQHITRKVKLARFEPEQGTRAGYGPGTFQYACTVKEIAPEEGKPA